VSTILETSKRQQIELQLQIKNASMTTVVFSATKGARFVSTFNETPFVTHKTEHLLSYS